MPASVTALPPSGSPSAYADVEVERRFTRPVRQGTEACFLIQGIRCGGCALSVERAMRRLPGMVQAEVNFATQRARAVWDPERIKLSDVLHSIENAGYGARPYDPLHAESRLAAERRERLYRLGIAGLFGMQV
ncbi:MAG: cation transporter, partial [Gammaproteobacteria bacterium]|nr:cation transporter [Gammaproteobacteria bacterium]